LSDSASNLVGGKLAYAQLKETKEPVARDWSKLWQHMLDSGDTDLVQNRLSVTAARQRMDIGEEIPGVEIIDLIDVTIKKV